MEVSSESPLSSPSSSTQTMAFVSFPQARDMYKEILAKYYLDTSSDQHFLSEFARALLGYSYDTLFSLLCLVLYLSVALSALVSLASSGTASTSALVSASFRLLLPLSVLAVSSWMLYRFLYEKNQARIRLVKGHAGYANTLKAPTAPSSYVPPLPPPPSSSYDRTSSSAAPRSAGEGGGGTATKLDFDEAVKAIPPVPRELLIPAASFGSGPLSDLYPVYRARPSQPLAHSPPSSHFSFSSSSSSSSLQNPDPQHVSASWSLVPSILLVDGDIIALQKRVRPPSPVGDGAGDWGGEQQQEEESPNAEGGKGGKAAGQRGDPSFLSLGCRVHEIREMEPNSGETSPSASSSQSSNSSVPPPPSPLVDGGGGSGDQKKRRYSLSKVKGAASSLQSPKSDRQSDLNSPFPSQQQSQNSSKGHYQSDSPKLLDLTNGGGMILYRLEGSVLSQMMAAQSRESGDLTPPRVPLVHRQLLRIRGSLFKASLALFILCGAVVLARSLSNAAPKPFGTDAKVTNNMYLVPLLAVLASCAGGGVGGHLFALLIIFESIGIGRILSKVKLVRQRASPRAEEEGREAGDDSEDEDEDGGEDGRARPPPMAGGGGGRLTDGVGSGGADGQSGGERRTTTTGESLRGLAESGVNIFVRNFGSKRRGQRNRKNRGSVKILRASLSFETTNKNGDIILFAESNARAKTKIRWLQMFGCFSRTISSRLGVGKAGALALSGDISGVGFSSASTPCASAAATSPGDGGPSADAEHVGVGYNLLENLGVVTSMCLVDDELVCENHAHPQQLLLPTAGGLKLLDLCEKWDDNDYDNCSDDEDGDSDAASDDDGPMRNTAVEDGGHPNHDDSDSDDEHYDSSVQMQKQSEVGRDNSRRSSLRRRRTLQSGQVSSATAPSSMANTRATEVEKLHDDMQFEDPLWWQYLPSAKSIGLASLLVERGAPSSSTSVSAPSRHGARFEVTSIQEAKRSLVEHVTQLRQRRHLISLAHCIGFETKETASGSAGDLSFFSEKRRIHYFCKSNANNAVSEDDEKGHHALGLEEARSRGKLRAHMTSVIVEDSRSLSHQMLTVGEAAACVRKCTDAWQGETATISPLSASERRAILDTAAHWALADLDVKVFAYAPVPFALERKFKSGKGSAVYLVENEGDAGSIIGSSSSSSSSSGSSTSSGRSVSSPANKFVSSASFDERASALSSSTIEVTPDDDWKLIENQIFLGLLGSTSGPRAFVAPFIKKCASSKIRFVYFSPRNMRRSKELASKMGIDVAWNCAISHRALDGQEHDPHRMVSSYADWDVNARLPHGIEEIRKHIVDVDNVPLLVSLFTDVTAETTKDMVEIYKEHHNTVLVLGCAHRYKNQRIFASADLAIGVNVLGQGVGGAGGLAAPSSSAGGGSGYSAGEGVDPDTLLPQDIEFATSVITHQCIFNLNLPTVKHLHEIIGESRAALEAATAAVTFVVVNSMSLSILCFFCLISPTIDATMLDPIHGFVYLVILLPLLGLGIACSEGDCQVMKKCPIMNDPDPDRVFDPGREEQSRRTKFALVRALLPAIGSFAVSAIDQRRSSLLMISQLSICAITASVSFIYRSQHIWGDLGWAFNYAWLAICLICSIAVLAILFVNTSDGTVWVSAGSWVVFTFFPMLNLAIQELYVKKAEIWLDNRLDQSRRLHFETRLGMFSPK